MLMPRNEPMTRHVRRHWKSSWPLLSSRWSVKITSFLKIGSTQSYSKLRLGLKGSNQKLCFNWKRPKLWASSGPRLEFEGSKQEDGLLLNKTKAWPAWGKILTWAFKYWSSFSHYGKFTLCLGFRARTPSSAQAQKGSLYLQFNHRFDLAAQDRMWD